VVTKRPGPVGCYDRPISSLRYHVEVANGGAKVSNNATKAFRQVTPYSACRRSCRQGYLWPTYKTQTACHFANGKKLGQNTTISISLPHSICTLTPGFAQGGGPALHGHIVISTQSQRVLLELSVLVLQVMAYSRTVEQQGTICDESPTRQHLLHAHLCTSC